MVRRNISTQQLIARYLITKKKPELHFKVLVFLKSESTLVVLDFAVNALH
jgi:hypothetical protein